MNIILRLQRRVESIEEEFAQTEAGQERLKILTTLETLKPYANGHDKRAGQKKVSKVINQANGLNSGALMREFLASHPGATEEALVQMLNAKGYRTQYPGRVVATSMRMMLRGGSVKKQGKGWALTPKGHKRVQEAAAEAVQGNV